jgi:hypothetical protein
VQRKQSIELTYKSPRPLASYGWFIMRDFTTSAGQAAAVPTNPATTLDAV